MPAMEKERWPEFLSSRIKSQISIENASKAQTWALTLFAFLALGFGLSAVGSDDRGASSIYSIKVLFLTLFHAVMILFFYLPSVLQRGEKVLAKQLGVRDFTSLLLVTLTLTFYSIVTCMLSGQVTSALREHDFSAFFGFTAWMNSAAAYFYTGALIFYLFCLLLTPGILQKIAERGSKAAYTGLGIHITLFLLTGLGYAEANPIGSPQFFDHFRVAGLFWTFISVSVLVIGRLQQESSVPALTALELEIASERLTRADVILARFKEVFVAKRFEASIRRISHQVAAQSHEIAKFAHEAIEFVGREKPSELDLRLVEDRYRRAEALYKKIEKHNQRTLVSFSFFDMTEVEREKAEFLKDQFSRELRNAKLELAQIRKRIDERLVAIKNTPLPAPAIAALPSLPPVEEEIISK
jgi:hypothetical protein